jgi:hypothetical protein
MGGVWEERERGRHLSCLVLQIHNCPLLLSYY